MSFEGVYDVDNNYWDEDDDNGGSLGSPSEIGGGGRHGIS